MGITKVPKENSMTKNTSTNDNVQVTVNALLGDFVQATNVAHELYGHGLLYKRDPEGKTYGHIYVASPKDDNKTLQKEIKESVKETVLNMKQ
ncbi:hypothetical protein D3H65_04260 [Paraflavitalea soli]|uniref:Uncharacterized protein n=1 Tax=Paraflavitalea soli TaxID=2315862 RepID=A0A3B7MNU3_9BACT|nr:hypothetical protein [Paraflavitalea soli]AXY73235.1 hypothetical protein D3H65_04260 [Paraflavitalea soli]